MKKKKCPKTITGKHIWMTWKYPQLRFYYECAACGVINDTNEDNE